MQIKGLSKTSAIDFPGKLASVLFTGGCNFRCPFCQNPQLVLTPGELADFRSAELLASLAGRRGFTDGVVISGGEPTLQPDLSDFLRQLRELGLAIKLDTNGYRPQVLAQLLADGLVDFVAMDVKSIAARYPQAAGIPLDYARIAESLHLLSASGVAYELRTTVVPGLVQPDDADELAQTLRGVTRYVLQQFRPAETLDPAWRQIAPYPAPVLAALAQRLTEQGLPTTVRGI